MEKQTLTRVFHQKEGRRVCDFLTNLSLDEVIAKNDFLSEPDRKIIRTQTEIVTIEANDYFENGILTTAAELNPCDDESMRVKPSDIADAEENDDIADFYRSIGQ